jgi:low affinity Fe/Cu permease
MPDGITLTPLAATAIFVVAVVAGYQYRRIWKAEGPRWQLWIAGLVAAICLLTVAFLPVRPA